MPNHVYPPVGRCIYCGTTELPLGVKRFSLEHIIPLSLGGNLLLPQASCGRCARIINKQIETPVILKEWGYLRIKRNFPSRNKDGKREARRTQVTLTRHDGRTMQIGVMDYSCPVPLYKFKEARILDGSPRGDDNAHWTMDVLMDHNDDAIMKKKFPEWNGHITLRPQPYEFSRLIAKIALSYAVAEYGLSGFTPLVRNIILGESDDYFLCVGGSLEVKEPVAGGDHSFEMRIFISRPNIGLLIVDIRLFSQITTPSYHVVVGEIDFNNIEHVNVFTKHRVEGKIPDAPGALG